MSTITHMVTMTPRVRVMLRIRTSTTGTTITSDQAFTARILAQRPRRPGTSFDEPEARETRNPERRRKE